MKIIVACILLSCAVSALAAQPRSLQDDFKEFEALIPADAIQSVVTKYYIIDGETRNFVKYLKGAQFRKVWDQVFTHPITKDVLEYLVSKDVDPTSLINQLADLLGLPHVQPTIANIHSRSLLGLYNEIVRLLPLDKFEALLNDKMENSEDFQELYQKITSIDYKVVEDFVTNSAEIQDFVQRLRNYKIPVDVLVEGVTQFFGWTY
uniref:Microvillar-like protein n=1 Tax=Lutzomyia longipalpis TaxID=7200 RepID=A8CW39_LUTLO|nr:microvillar-like protein [Lutzomyia longipalpis]